MTEKPPEPVAQAQLETTSTINEQKHPAPAEYKPKRIIIFNPCGCCCCRRCNLRMNCIFIASYLIIHTLVISILWLSTFPADCDDDVKINNRTRVRHCRLYAKDKDDIATARIVFLVGLYGSRTVNLVAGVVLVAAILMRSGICSLIAGTLMILLYPIFMCINGYAWHRYLTNWPHLIRESSQTSPGKYKEDENYVTTSISLALLVSAILEIYLGVCVVLLGSHVKEDIDLEPHEPFKWKVEIDERIIEPFNDEGSERSAQDDDPSHINWAAPSNASPSDVENKVESP